MAREKLVKGKDWESIAKMQIEEIFTMTDKDDSDLRRLADLYSDDRVGNILDPSSLPMSDDVLDNDFSQENKPENTSKDTLRFEEIID